MKYIFLERLKKIGYYYRKIFINSLYINILITLIIYYLQNNLKILPNSVILSLTPTLIYIILVLLIYIPIIFDILNTFKGLVVYEIIAKWFIVNKEGDISSDFKYNLYNNSDVPILEFCSDREGFYKEVNYNPNYYINNRKIITRSSKKSKRNILYHNMDIGTYIYENNLEINPALEPKEELILYRQYDVSKSEKGAFTSKGTFAGLRIFYPTNKVVMYLFSPPHYKATLLNYFVGDENGNILFQERKRQLSPKVLYGSHCICWTIIYPKTNYRYWFKYRIEKL